MTKRVWRKHPEEEKAIKEDCQTQKTRVKHRKNESSRQNCLKAFQKVLHEQYQAKKVLKNHVLSIVCKTSRNFGQIRN